MKQKWKNPGGAHIYKKILNLSMFEKTFIFKKAKWRDQTKQNKQGGTVIKVLNIDHFLFKNKTTNTLNDLDTAVSWKHSWVSTIIVSCGVSTLLHQWGHFLQTSVTEQKYWAIQWKLNGSASVFGDKMSWQPKWLRKCGLLLSTNKAITTTTKGQHFGTTCQQKNIFLNVKL